MAFKNRKDLLLQSKADNLAKVQGYCELEIDGPEQVDIKDAFDAAIPQNSLKVLTYLRKFECISEEQVSNAVESICRNFEKDEKWNFLQELCTADVKNKPNQTAVETVLQEAISANKWALVETLGNLKTSNAPSQDAIDNLVAKAAEANKWELMLEFFKLETINKPSQAGLSKILKYAVISGTFSFEQLKALLEQPIVKAKQESIINLINAYLKRASTNTDCWNEINYLLQNLCTLEENKVEIQEIVDKAFKAMAFSADPQKHTTELINLCQLSAELAPSQKTLAEVLAAAGGNKSKIPLILIKTICETKTNAPDQSQVSKALLTALDEDPVIWDYVGYLCSLTRTNCPDEAALDKCLESLTQKKDVQWDLMKTLLSEKKLGQKAVGKLINTAFMQKFPLAMLQHLIEKSITKPSKEDISAALIYICKWRDDESKWEFIDYLSSLEGNFKADENAMNQALMTIVKSDQLNSGKKLQLIKKLCAKDNDGPSKGKIASALRYAFEHQMGDIVGFFCELKTKNKPDQSDLEILLAIAITNHLDLKTNIKIADYYLNQVQYLCELKTENAPSQKAINDKLMVAAKDQSQSSAKALNLIKYFCKLKTKNAPSEEGINAAFIAAANYGFLYAVRYLYQLVTSQDAINKALFAAAETGYIHIVKFLCESNLKPTLETISAASKDCLEKPEQFYKDIGTYLDNLAKSRIKAASKTPERYPQSDAVFFKTPTKQVQESQFRSPEQQSQFTPKSRGRSQSCFTADEISKIDQRIAELTEELQDCCLWFFGARKQDKIDGLEALKTNAKTMSRVDAINAAVNAYSNLRAGGFGLWGNRTDDLLNELENPQQAQELACY